MTICKLFETPVMPKIPNPLGLSVKTAPYVPYCTYPVRDSRMVAEHLLPTAGSPFTFSSASAPEAKGNVVRSTRI